MREPRKGTQGNSAGTNRPGAENEDEKAPDAGNLAVARAIEQQRQSPAVIAGLLPAGNAAVSGYLGDGGPVVQRVVDDSNAGGSQSNAGARQSYEAWLGYWRARQGIAKARLDELQEHLRDTDPAYAEHKDKFDLGMRGALGRAHQIASEEWDLCDAELGGAGEVLKWLEDQATLGKAALSVDEISEQALVLAEAKNRGELWWSLISAPVEMVLGMKSPMVGSRIPKGARKSIREEVAEEFAEHQERAAGSGALERDLAESGLTIRPLFRPPASASTVVKVGAGPGGSKDPMVSALEEHVIVAQARFNREGFTPNQTKAIEDAADEVARNTARARFYGDRIDEFVKESAPGDFRLNRLGISERMQPGPDFWDPQTDIWYDLTTARSWQAHVKKYGDTGYGVRVPTGR